MIARRQVAAIHACRRDNMEPVAGAGGSDLSMWDATLTP